MLERPHPTSEAPTFDQDALATPGSGKHSNCVETITEHVMHKKTFMVNDA